MEPQFQSSFIPKRPITQDTSHFTPQTTMPVGIFSFLGNTLLTVTILVCIGLFAYTKILEKAVSQSHTEIVAAKNVFQPETIQTLISTSNKLSSIDKLLDKHTAPSEIFTTLQSLAFKKVRFGDFTYTNKNNTVSVVMQIEAASYNTLSQQADVFMKSPFIIQPTFTEFKVLETGNISAKFSATIDPTLVSYKKMLDVLSAQQNTISTSTQATSTNIQ